MAIGEAEADTDTEGVSHCFSQNRVAPSLIMVVLCAIIQIFMATNKDLNRYLQQIAGK
ncbi:hypothetical protein IQ247_06320 [Plectonema cf. radiosum LEGE 06105]|uniref:Uncharacterized protein n=1 Tax=Plectonema cf. radiosum LEGE 06105 TaxID=945769 RepID=A0A8J7F0M1_9CYAN|nr:hypothetical protein [Plectonema radiosum]MBE9212325.1 hypothetical protein [Plectonema cf. radiosum LEGE 06105]